MKKIITMEFDAPDGNDGLDGWNRGVAVADVVVKLLRSLSTDPADGVGALAIALAQIGNAQLPNPRDREGFKRLLSNFETCYGGAVDEVLGAEGATKQ